MEQPFTLKIINTDFGVMATQLELNGELVPCSSAKVEWQEAGNVGSLVITIPLFRVKVIMENNNAAETNRPNL